MKPIILNNISSWWIIVAITLLLAAYGRVHADPYAVEALEQLESYKKGLISTASEEEKRIAEKVVLEVPISIGIEKVGAFTCPLNIPTIVINLGTIIQIKELSRAISLSYRLKRKDDYLIGYTRYVAYWSLFETPPMTAKQFAELYTKSEGSAALSVWSDQEEALARGFEVGIMMFLLAHELAHHVYKDTDCTNPSTAAERRKQERRADLWAAQRLEALSVSSVIGIIPMLLLNESNGREANSLESQTHDLPTQRMIELVNASTNSLKFDTADSNIMPKRFRSLNDWVLKLIHKQKMLEGDYLNILKHAKNGDVRAQLRLSYLYRSGELSAVPRNMKLARYWSEVAATNQSPYGYLDSAEAHYRSGVLYSQNAGIHKPDWPLACEYLRRSAAMSFHLGKHALMYFRNNGQCI